MNNFSMLPLIMAMLLLSAHSLKAEDEKYTVATDSFFMQQTGYYQAWLMQSGLGNVLKVNKVLTNIDNNRVTLKLVTIITSNDSAFAAYSTLADSVFALDKVRLAELLFWKMINLLDVQPGQATLTISSDTVYNQNAFLYTVGVDKDSGRLFIDKERGLFSENQPSINVNAANIAANIKPVSVTIDMLPKKTLLSYSDFLSVQLQNYCRDKKAKLEDNSLSDEQLNFSICDIQNEVISIDGNNRPYEKINYTIKLKADSGRLTLTFVDVQGYYGSNFGGHPPTSKLVGQGYTPMNLVTAFKTALTEYQTQRFPAKVRKWLLTTKINTHE